MSRISAALQKYLLSGNDLLQLGWTLCCPPIHALSENHRWLLVFSRDSQKYRVWDLANETIALEIAMNTSPLVYYGDESFVISDYSAEETRQSLFYHDGTKIELPIGGVYFEVLPDNTLLYEQVARDERLAVGIYRYDPRNNIFALLAPNAHRLLA